MKFGSSGPVWISVDFLGIHAETHGGLRAPDNRIVSVVSLNLRGLQLIASCLIGVSKIADASR